MVILRVHRYPSFELLSATCSRVRAQSPVSMIHLSLPTAQALPCAPCRCCNESLLGDPFIPWAPAIDGVELGTHPLDLLIEEKAGWNHPAELMAGSKKICLMFKQVSGRFRLV